jgi:hypothetical protein
MIQSTSVLQLSRTSAHAGQQWMVRLIGTAFFRDFVVLFVFRSITSEMTQAMFPNEERIVMAPRKKIVAMAGPHEEKA